MKSQNLRLLKKKCLFCFAYFVLKNSAGETIGQTTPKSYFCGCFFIVISTVLPVSEFGISCYATVYWCLSETDLRHYRMQIYIGALDNGPQL